MIPDSLASLALFLALLSPGFVYLQARERRHPGVEYSALREVSLVAVTSVVTLSAVALVLGVVRALLPSATPDIGRFVREGDVYLRAHYVEAALWTLAAIAGACALAWMWAVPPRVLSALGGRAGAWVTERRGPGVIIQQSGWSAAFDLWPGTRKVVELVLEDGTSLFGTLASRSTQIAETADRDLVLSYPLQVREVGGEWTVLPKAGTVVVSASRIKYMVVSYEESAPPGA